MKNGRYYIGRTNDLKRRLIEHKRDGNSYVGIYVGNFKLVFSQEFQLTESRIIKKMLKKLKNKKVIKAIVEAGKLIVEDGKIHWKGEVMDPPRKLSG